MPARSTSPYERISDAIDGVVGSLLESAGATRPPVDVIRLARRLGVEVALDASSPGRARTKRLRYGSVVLLRPDDRPERLQWATAHELGELHAGRIFEAAGLAPEDDSSGRVREQAANAFAARLLLPTQWIRRDAETVGGDLYDLKAIHRHASHELIATRLLDVTGPLVVTIFDNERVTRRRGNGSARPGNLIPAEAACWQEAHRTGEVVRVEQEGVAVSAWPIHEAEWKREILLTRPER